MAVDSMEDIEATPVQGQWPVDPQDDQPIKKSRIWIDGCFDFSHHGHAGAMLQARRLGEELYVGIHSDEDILEHKGPAVMNLEERVAAVDACRWSTLSVPKAPYVTSLPWISHYGCHFVVHGDDITSDRDGEDCYRFVKAAGRFLVVKRTPGISTTDLVGRMLLCTKSHFIRSLEDVLDGKDENGADSEITTQRESMLQRMSDYATGPTGKEPGCEVWLWRGALRAKCEPGVDDAGSFSRLVSGQTPLTGQRVVYVDGGFDLFSTGHIEFLKLVVESEAERGRMTGWYAEERKNERISEAGRDYPPAYIVVGVHDDLVINRWKGLNYPIMNIFERGLCVLQCKYVSALIFSTPFSPSSSFLAALPFASAVSCVYHGRTTFIPTDFDPYTAAKSQGIYHEINEHPFQDLNAGTIVRRILDGRVAFEERQRRKGEKAILEHVVQDRERLELDALEKERQAKQRSLPA